MLDMSYGSLGASRLIVLQPYRRPHLLFASRNQSFMSARSSESFTEPDIEAGAGMTRPGRCVCPLQQGKAMKDVGRPFPTVLHCAS